jgi:hypothetical protein
VGAQGRLFHFLADRSAGARRARACFVPFLNFGVFWSQFQESLSRLALFLPSTRSTSYKRHQLKVMVTQFVSLKHPRKHFATTTLFVLHKGQEWYFSSYKNMLIFNLKVKFSTFVKSFFSLSTYYV